MREYLKAWRKGHLGVQTIGQATDGPTPTPEEIAARHRKNAPVLQVLSLKTILLELKNFEDYNREPLIALLKAESSNTSATSELDHRCVN